MKKIELKKNILAVVIITSILISLPYNSSATNKENNNQFSVNNIDRTDWTLTDIEIVSKDSTSASEIPSIATDSQDNIHIVWYDDSDYDSSGSDYDIFYSKYDIKTETWSPTLVLSDNTGVSYNPRIAIDSQDNIHVVWHDGTDDDGEGDIDIYYTKYDSTAESWGSIETLSASSTLPSYYPDIAVDPEDNIYVCWEDYEDDDAEGDKDIYYTKWKVSTESWTTMQTVSTESDLNSDYSCLAIDNIGNVYFTWVDISNYGGSGSDADAFFKKYDPVLDEWTTTEVLTPESDQNVYSWPYIDVDSKQNLHLCWFENSDLMDSGADYDVFYRKYNAQLETWSTITVVSEDSNYGSVFPNMVVENDGTAHIIYREQGNFLASGTDYDIFYRYFDLDTQAWSDYILVSQECAGSGWTPDIAIDSKGYVHMTWQDLSDILGSGTDADILYKRFVGSPNSPILAPIVPSSSSDGIIDIEWTEEIGAENYYIFRDTSYIWSLSGLNAIEKTNQTSFTDEIANNGTYYYAVIAESMYGNSTMSNIESVEVTILPEPEPEPEPEGEFIGIPQDLLIIGGAIIGFQFILFILGLLFRKKS